jgi:hypothetical protein
MPDLMPIFQGMGAAALFAAAALLLFGWPWRAPHAMRVRAGSVLGVGLGCIVGCWLAGASINWPPREIHDRFLLILLPAVIAVELVAVFFGRPWLVWPLRLAVAAGAGRLLLDKTIYVADLEGVNRLWTPTQTWMVLGALALALAAVWTLLVVLVRRAPGRSVPIALALACAGGAVTVMLSGSFTGGLPGLVFAAALTCAMAASLVLSDSLDVSGVVGLGVIGLFALVIGGHFMSELTLVNAVLLFMSPLLCWLPELPPRLRGLGKVGLAAVPVGAAVLLALNGSSGDSSRTATNAQSPANPAPASAKEPTIQDYMNFRK